VEQKAACFSFIIKIALTYLVYLKQNCTFKPRNDVYISFILQSIQNQVYFVFVYILEKGNVRMKSCWHGGKAASVSVTEDVLQLLWDIPQHHEHNNNQSMIPNDLNKLNYTCFEIIETNWILISNLYGCHISFNIGWMWTNLILKLYYRWTRAFNHTP